MSLLCSCAGKRRKKEKDDNYYYSQSRTPTPGLAPTPKVKRKFPEGVVILPSVPSDLEEAVGEIPSVSEVDMQALDVTQSEEQQQQQEEALECSEHEEAILIVSQQETVESGWEPIVSGSLQMALKVSRKQTNESTKPTNSLSPVMENTVKVTDHKTCDHAAPQQPEVKLHATNKGTIEGHGGVTIEPPLYTFGQTRIESDVEKNRCVASQLEMTSLRKQSYTNIEQSDLETADESSNRTPSQVNELAADPSTIEWIDDVKCGDIVTRSTRSQGSDLLNRVKDFFLPKQASKLEESYSETGLYNVRDDELSKREYKSADNSLSSSEAVKQEDSIATQCSSSQFSENSALEDFLSIDTFKQDVDAYNVQTQCDFSDFEDDNEDLLCFQEEEEYLNQLSDIKSKSPSLWDDADRSSLKSSELFDVIQGEVEYNPTDKKKSQKESTFLKSDKIWQDIKDTLLTLINDKDSDLLQELRTPLDDIPNLEYMTTQGQFDDDVAVKMKGRDEFKVPSKDVKTICQHIDDYFAAQEKKQDDLVKANTVQLKSKYDHPLENDRDILCSKNTLTHEVNKMVNEEKQRCTNDEYCSENPELQRTKFQDTCILNSLAYDSCLTRVTAMNNAMSQMATELSALKSQYLTHCDFSAHSDDVSVDLKENLRQERETYPEITTEPKNRTFVAYAENDKIKSTCTIDAVKLSQNNLGGDLNDSVIMDNRCQLPASIEPSVEGLPYNVGANQLENPKDGINVQTCNDNDLLLAKEPNARSSNGNILEVNEMPLEHSASESLHNNLGPISTESKTPSNHVSTETNKFTLQFPIEEAALKLHKNNIGNHLYNHFQMHVGILIPHAKPKSTLIHESTESTRAAGETVPQVVTGNLHPVNSLLKPNTEPVLRSNGIPPLHNTVSSNNSQINDVTPFSSCKPEFNDTEAPAEAVQSGVCVSQDAQSPDRNGAGGKRVPARALYLNNEARDDQPALEDDDSRALDLAQNSNVQDAFVIAVEQQARERLERLSALKRIKPVDMTKLSQQLNQQIPATEQQELNGFIESSPIYVTSIPPSAAATPIKPAEPAAQPPPARRVPPPARGAGVAVKVTPGGGGSTSTNGHVSSLEEPDSSEIELTQELGDKEPAPSGSPFANGRTEVLIGQDEPGGRVRTTAIVESSKLAVGEDRPRRRSGSSIVVVDTGQEAGDKSSAPADTPVADDALDMMMMTLDNGPHREMAVDVPDSFIARSKTPPRYPPPRPQARIPQQPPTPTGLNGSAAPKPVPPPRDHLRIERDGRLVNRAPAPQVPARTPINNNNNNNNTEREPTKEQLDSIRKFQEALRKRKEEEERVAQQNEFLNRSLRGSCKLQALESHPPPVGVLNDGYSSADEGELAAETDPLRRVVGYGELVASLQRLQLQLKKSSLGQGGYSSLEGQLAAVQTLLLSPQFGRALAVYNKVQQVWAGRVTPPASAHAQSLVRDCLDTLQPCSLAGAAELADLLTRYEIEGLLHAHDAIAATTAPASMPAGSPIEDEVPVQLPGSDNIRIIKIEKTNEPLGATVRNEGDAVIIGRIVRGGAAEKSGLLHEGDEVLEVNGIEMRGKSVNDVCDILSGMTGTLTFLIVPESTARPLPPATRDTLMHMKAHFDYDPEEDLYIPCRELGISFQKGDVLHVISQDDPNWWQAYREGEEDQTLAGLIPSRSFQHQRESMKQTIAGDKLTKEKTKKAGTLLCAKKNPKKKKKKLPYNAAYNDGSYPLYATSTVDDYDAEEILTYEEVSLYYPRANHKRPIVLIGPPNIGRHELRQRLMEDAERFAAAIPHTSRSRKDGEVDGQDYHFITRAQFESDILARKFVEHGEYEKAYYGTSLDAIRSVVNSGKICVLNLHPQSLKILRSSDLKPYVVFVAPPSLEKLRQKKIRNGEAYKEDELKDIIEKAREMEDKYGHYFDMIIINNDTDRAYHQLLNEINSLEREPQWVPASWVKAT